MILRKNPSLSLFSNANELQMCQNLFIHIILHYRNACTELWLTCRTVYHVLVLGQCSVNRRITSKLPRGMNEHAYVGGSEWALNPHHTGVAPLVLLWLGCKL